MGSVLAVTPLAHAHPGHDGHELTWDFRHLAAHPLATIGCFAVAGLAVGVVWQLWRYRAANRAAPESQR